MELRVYLQLPAHPLLVLRPGPAAGPTFANHFWNKGGWIQNRANTLALWCMFAQVFPLFQDNSVFSTITSVYADGFMNPAVRPTAANPTAQGVVSIVALVVNRGDPGYIIKRAKAQKKNPLQAGDLHRSERLPGSHGESLSILFRTAERYQGGGGAARAAPPLCPLYQ